MSKEDAVAAARSGLEHGHFFCETPVRLHDNEGRLVNEGEATSGADWIVRGLLNEIERLRDSERVYRAGYEHYSEEVERLRADGRCHASPVTSEPSR